METVLDDVKQKNEPGSDLSSEHTLFSFRPGLEALCVEQVSKSIGDYLSMYNRGFFKTNDLLVLQLFQKYSYVTRNLISKHIDSKDNLKSVFKKLKKAGLIVQYSLVYPVETESGEITSKKIIDYYTLSDVGYKVSKSISNSGHLSVAKGFINAVNAASIKCLDAAQILTMIALNTFRASLETDYKDRLNRIYSNYRFTENNFSLSLTMYEMDAPVKNFLLIPICIRRNMGWRRSFRHLYNIINSRLSSQFSQFELLFVVVVEDGAMACDAAKGLDRDVNNVVYVTDFSANCSNVLNNIIVVDRDNRSKYKLVSIN